jgi:hypothetical protein
MTHHRDRCHLRQKSHQPPRPISPTQSQNFHYQTQAGMMGRLYETHLFHRVISEARLRLA